MYFFGRHLGRNERTLPDSDEMLPSSQPTGSILKDYVSRIPVTEGLANLFYRNKVCEHYWEIGAHRRAHAHTHIHIHNQVCTHIGTHEHWYICVCVCVCGYMQGVKMISRLETKKLTEIFPLRSKHLFQRTSLLFEVFLTLPDKLLFISCPHIMQLRRIFSLEIKKNVTRYELNLVIADGIAPAQSNESRNTF